MWKNWKYDIWNVKNDEKYSFFKFWCLDRARCENVANWWLNALGAPKIIKSSKVENMWFQMTNSWRITNLSKFFQIILRIWVVWELQSIQKIIWIHLVLQEWWKVQSVDDHDYRFFMISESLSIFSQIICDHLWAV